MRRSSGTWGGDHLGHQWVGDAMGARLGPAGHHQPATVEGPQPTVELGRVEVGHGRQHLQVDRVAGDGEGLGDPSGHGTGPVDPRGDQGPGRRRRLGRTARRPYLLGQLGEEQRIAGGPAADVGRGRGGRLAEQDLGQPPAGHHIEAADRQGRRWGLLAGHRTAEEVGPGHQGQEERDLDPGRQHVEELPQPIGGGVGVVDHQDGAIGPDGQLQGPGPGVEGLGGRRRDRRGIGIDQGQQVVAHPGPLPGRQPGVDEQQVDGGDRVRAEGGPVQADDRGVRPLTVRPAGHLEPAPHLRPHPRLELGHQPGLADPGLTGHDHHVLGGRSLALPPTIHQRRQLAIPADEGPIERPVRGRLEAHQHELAVASGADGGEIGQATAGPAIEERSGSAVGVGSVGAVGQQRPKPIG